MPEPFTVLIVDDDLSDAVRVKQAIEQIARDEIPQLNVGQQGTHLVVEEIHKEEGQGIAEFRDSITGALYDADGSPKRIDLLISDVRFGEGHEFDGLDICREWLRCQSRNLRAGGVILMTQYMFALDPKEIVSMPCFPKFDREDEDLGTEPRWPEFVAWMVVDRVARQSSPLTGPLWVDDICLGTSFKIRHAYDLVQSVARSDETVLIEGEIGVGKTLAGKLIHGRSNRSSGPLIHWTCQQVGADPSWVISNLFGHTRGAFSGAVQDHDGCFDQAQGGTLFLDDIHLLSDVGQGSLLQALQDGTYRPLGSSQTRRHDVRLLVGTNQNLAKLTDEGKFKPELFSRIYVLPIHIPSLSERREDIPLIARSISRRLRLPPISDDACTWLARQDWKYNVRGLEAFLKRTRVIVCSENGPPQQLEVEDFEKAKSLDQQHEEREVQAPGYARLTIRPARDGDIEAAATDRPSWMLAGEPTEKYWVSRSFSEAIKVEFEAEAKRLGLDVGWQTIEPEAAASGVLALGLLLRFPDSAVARLLRLGVVESKFYDRILRVFKQHEWLIKGGDVRTAKWSIHPDRRRDVATLLAVVRESLSPRLQQTVDEFMAGPGPG